MNKQIFVYWNKGFQNAPFVVQICLESLKFYKSSFEVVELNDMNIGDYITLPDCTRWPNFPVALKSDIIRTMLLSKYGGVWSDATILYNKPIDSWLPNCLKKGWFAFYNSNASSFFLAAEKNNYLVSTLEKYFINKIYTELSDKQSLFVNNWIKSPYYLLWHICFSSLVKTDPIFKDISDSAIRMCNLNCIKYLLHYGLTLSITNDYMRIVDSDIYPCFKLTYKYDYNLKIKNTALSYAIKHFLRKSIDYKLANLEPSFDSASNIDLSEISINGEEDFNIDTHSSDMSENQNVITHTALAHRDRLIEGYKYNNPAFKISGSFCTFENVKVGNGGKFHVYQFSSPFDKYNAQIWIPFNGNSMYIRNSNGKGKYSNFREFIFADDLNEIKSEIELLKKEIKSLKSN